MTEGFSLGRGIGSLINDSDLRELLRQFFVVFFHVVEDCLDGKFGGYFFDAARKTRADFDDHLEMLALA